MWRAALDSGLSRTGARSKCGWEVELVDTRERADWPEGEAVTERDVVWETESNGAG